jgi:branched-chain amino acid transport system permease protein
MQSRPNARRKRHHTGFALGVVEGLTKVLYPQASSTVIFVIFTVVLLVKPAGLFGRAP